MPSAALRSAVRQFTTTILNPYDLPDLLHCLTDHVVAVADAAGAGIMLAGRGGGRLGFAAASDERAVQVEVIQDRIDAGPCVEAFQTGRIGCVEDLAHLGRWPEYEERAIELGFRSVLAVPMHAWGRTIGVLNIYRDAPGPWSDADIEAAEILTAMGAGYVLHADQSRAQHELSEQLQQALESRDVIGQAKGILMVRHGVTAEVAFEMLRRVSQDTNVKVRDVAAKVAASG